MEIKKKKLLVTWDEEKQQDSLQKAVEVQYSLVIKFYCKQVNLQRIGQQMLKSFLRPLLLAFQLRMTS